MRACTPILSFRYTEPAFFLKKIKEHDLAHKLFSKVYGADMIGLKFLSDGRVFGSEPLECRLNVAKQCSVLFEEFLGDGLDAEGVFELCKGREIVRILKQGEKTRL